MLCQGVKLCAAGLNAVSFGVAREIYVSVLVSIKVSFGLRQARCVVVYHDTSITGSSWQKYLGGSPFQRRASVCSLPFRSRQLNHVRLVHRLVQLHEQSRPTIETSSTKRHTPVHQLFP